MAELVILLTTGFVIGYATRAFMSWNRRRHRGG
jgi:hypothetical protein